MGLPEQFTEENARAMKMARAAAAGFIAAGELEREILDPAPTGNVTSLNVTEARASDPATSEASSDSAVRTA